MKKWTFLGQAQRKEMSEDQAAVQTLMRINAYNEMEKVLVMGWETESDSVRFLLKRLDAETDTTKRSNRVSSTSHSNGQNYSLENIGKQV